jgi:hypothetical protein
MNFILQLIIISRLKFEVKKYFQKFILVTPLGVVYHFVTIMQAMVFLVVVL